MSYKLIISIVPRNYGEVITGAASKAGAGGGTIIMGNGISGNNVLSLLGFGQSDKDITFVIVEEEILENIALLRKGKTTIVIASRISTVNKMDKILVLNEGKVEAFDTPANLLKTSPTYKRMVYLQKLEDELEGGAK